MSAPDAANAAMARTEAALEKDGGATRRLRNTAAADEKTPQSANSAAHWIEAVADLLDGVPPLALFNLIRHDSQSHLLADGAG